MRAVIMKQISRSLFRNPLKAKNNKVRVIKENLDKLQSKFLSSQGNTPLHAIDTYRKSLTKIKKEVEAKQTTNSFFYQDSQTVTSTLFLIDECFTAINQILCAEKSAKKMVEEHQKVIKKIVNHFKVDETRNGSPRGVDYMYMEKTDSIFEFTTTAHQQTWSSLKRRLEQAKAMMNKKYNHNFLALFLTADDAEFLDHIEYRKIPLGGEEIGHIAIQRLKHIASQSKIKERYIRARKLLVEVSFSTNNTLLSYNDSALEGEITKLALHALLHPEKKRVWLGSSRAVISVIKNHKDDAIYLNSTDKEWSWELNRAWLQAAVKMGYEFRLVEQHFPNIEKAILSKDPANLLLELANEIRPANKTSQYNGSDSPTATTQEILVLMDMGCTPNKNEDGSISFLPPMTKEEPSFIRESVSSFGLKRTHSCPSFFKAGPLPPLDNRVDHFKEPESSPEIRKQNSCEF